tara:strand:- start:242 stop:712 length:471 start_codon:yes stop_codon:yes gene_type:complete
VKYKLIVVGKTGNKNFENLNSNYINRIDNLVKFEVIEIIPKKNLKNNTQVKIDHECNLILGRIRSDEVVIILDDKAKNPSSTEFSNFIKNLSIYKRKNIVFVVGGHMGFNKKVKERADHKISFSKMTFNHKMIRLFFLEQFYRALTIIKNHPYHNE